MKFMMISLVLVYSLILSGCISKMENLLTDTKKASPENTRLGKINRNAPIIRDSSMHRPTIQERLRKKRMNQQYKREFEMVGYIISRYKEPEFEDMYLYTFTDALRTQRIQFYSKKILRYPPNQLVRVYIKDNFLKRVEKYRSVTGKRSKSYIEAAKEYIIRFK